MAARLRQFAKGASADEVRRPGRWQNVCKIAFLEAQMARDLRDFAA
jgi:hypothetical protein